MPVFDIPLVRRDAKPAGSDELGQAVVSVEATNVKAAIKRAEAQYPSWAVNPAADIGSSPIPDGERLSKILRIWE